jgi:chromosome segregation ATPase
MSKVKEVKGQSKFVVVRLANVNKTEAEKVTESTLEILEDNVLSCEASIDDLKNEIKTAEAQLKRANNKLAKLEKRREEVRFEIAPLAQYINNKNLIKSMIHEVKTSNWRNEDNKSVPGVNICESNLSSLKIQLAEYEAMLEDFNATV